MDGLYFLDCLSAFYFLLIEFHYTFFHFRYSNTYFFFLRMGQWMDSRCRVGSLGNSSTAPGRSNPDGTVGQSYSEAVGTSFFFLARFISFHTHSSLFIIFFRFFVFF